MGPRSSDRGYVIRGLAMPENSNASMGPRSSDRGYALRGAIDISNGLCFNGSTVLRPWLCTQVLVLLLLHLPASMGPRSSDRGYVRGDVQVLKSHPFTLQWVHGPQTVVMAALQRCKSSFVRASMGPRSSDRGYVF